MTTSLESLHADQEVFCRKCDAENPATNNFCGKCGIPLVRGGQPFVPNESRLVTGAPRKRSAGRGRLRILSLFFSGLAMLGELAGFLLIVGGAYLLSGTCLMSALGYSGWNYSCDAQRSQRHNLTGGSHDLMMTLHYLTPERGTVVPVDAVAEGDMSALTGRAKNLAAFRTLYYEKAKSLMDTVLHSFREAITDEKLQGYVDGSR